MCGVTGFLDPTLPSDALLRDRLAVMTGCLAHRGPDGTNVWHDAAAGIGLGHTRLAIIDLSPAGYQPMLSASGRYVISYNGELYNTDELRDELAPQRLNWRGHSDTEVLLEACAKWGVEASLRRANGMFAIALWDRQERTLYLARDRLGIKPMYWAVFGGLFVFGSELKALRAHGGWRPEIDRDALAAYMRLCYVPAPHTIYRGVCKLEPGSFLTLSPGHAPRIARYWSMEEVEWSGRAARKQPEDATAVERLHALLKDAVRRQLVSDVPLGVFLSGGIDSSAVTALMQASSGKKVKSFSIGFREAGFDESQAAKAVARHLGTDHTELYLDSDHALEVVPRLVEYYDEPFGDSSQIPTYLVSEMTRKHVTVALSGDGGDELFAGYSRYFSDGGVKRSLGSLRQRAHAALASVFQSAPREDEDAIYRRMLGHWHDPEELVQEAHEVKGALWDPQIVRTFPDRLERMQYLDTITYLPDDILTKVDRASMAVSLETRVPLLDHRVVELAWQLPASTKTKDGRGKWALRQVLYKYVPPALVDRPKMGFGVPIGGWLRGRLRDWAEDLLDEVRLRQDGILRPDMVHRVWHDHLADRGNWQYPLWDVLMFQAWRRRWA